MSKDPKSFAVDVASILPLDRRVRKEKAGTRQLSEVPTSLSVRRPASRVKSKPCFFDWQQIGFKAAEASLRAILNLNNTSRKMEQLNVTKITPKSSTTSST
jgi:hypothetical protein